MISKRTITDAEGRYYFPEWKGFSLFGLLLPHEPIITQVINFIEGYVVYEGWYASKATYEANSEAGGVPLNLVCDLRDEAGLIPLPNNMGGWGTCRVKDGTP